MRVSRISTLSAFKRPDEHLTRRTLHGGIVTLVGVLLASTLFVHEVSWYFGSKPLSRMEVDLRRHRDLSISLDVTFHAVPCAALSVDVIDASGTADSDVNHASGARLRKMRLGADGRPVGEYETPQSQRSVQQGMSTVVNVDLAAAMKHMGDMEDEMGLGEGCRVSGDVVVRRVAGRLHFAVHQQSFVDMLPQMLTGHVLPRIRNMSHTVHGVSFGPRFPGQVSPLDGTSRVEPEGGQGRAWKYFVKVVPTEYKGRSGQVLETNQYSVSEYSLPLLPPAGAASSAASSGQQQQQHGRKKDPFVNMIYDLSPIVMRIQQSPLGGVHFLVRLCAVVGGALSLTKLLDGVVHSALAAAGAPEARACRGSAHGGVAGAGASCGGGAGGVGGGYASARPSFGGAFDGALPTSQRSSMAGACGVGGSGGGSSSMAGSLIESLGGAIARHSSGGLSGLLPVNGGGSLGGGGGGGSLGGRGAIPMSSLSGLAPPALGGFGSWSQVDAEGGPMKKW